MDYNVECDRCKKSAVFEADTKDLAIRAALESNWQVDGDGDHVLCDACANNVVTLHQPLEYAPILRKRDKVAIVGFAISSRLMAPFEHPDFDIWSINELGMIEPKVDRCTHVLFNLHRAYEIEPANREYLMRQEKPIVLLEAVPELPQAIIFPHHEVMRHYGDYFTSSIAWMFAFAILEGYREIHVYGVDMAMDDEYSFQRPCMDYWIGFARGLGINVVLPPTTMLCTKQWLYGYEDPPQNDGPVPLSWCRERERELLPQLEKARIKGAHTEGMLSMLAQVSHRIRCHRRDTGKIKQLGA